MTPCGLVESSQRFGGKMPPSAGTTRKTTMRYWQLWVSVRQILSPSSFTEEQFLLQVVP